MKEVGTDERDLGSIPEYGVLPSKMPDDFKEAIKYAADLQEKIFRGKT